MSGFFDFIRKLYDKTADEILSKISEGYVPTGPGGNIAQMIYPQDLFSPECSSFILFFAVDPTAPMTILDKIALYMPRNVEVQYGINYSDATNLFEAATDIGLDALDYFKDPLSVAAVGGGAIAGLRAARGGGLLAKAVGLGAGAGVGIVSSATRSNKIGQTLGLQTKKLLNPHLAATFEGVAFRRHDFSFDLVARNREESETIHRIVYTFKYHAHPEAQNPDNETTFWNWPSNWHIGLFSPARKYLYNISTCAITTLGVNYTAAGSRAFFADTGAPVAVKLNLSFIETELMTRGRIRQGF